MDGTERELRQRLAALEKWRERMEEWLLVHFPDAPTQFNENEEES